MAAVTLRDIVKVYGRQAAVRGIDLDIPDKLFTVFVGPSGCGKSTTLRMIAGLEVISHGELTMDGVVVNDMPSRDRGVAMVFQSYALYPHMTVYDNLAFSLKLERLSADAIKARVDKAVSILELAPFLGRKPAQLSGGQRQRVAMGRAIVREPKVFLFDEPLSNLDAKLRNQMRIEIKKLQRRLQVTTIYVTHDQVEAMTLADIIVVMRDGIVEQTGTPIDIFERPVNRFVAGFIGSPPMNFFEGAVRDRMLECGGIGFPLPARREDWTQGAKLVAGFRPEDIVPDGHGIAPRRSVEVQTSIDFNEMLGNETLLFAAAGGREFVSRMAQPRMVAQNEPMTFRFNLEKMHLFHGETGQSVKDA